jgi:pyruvate kinase
MVRIQRRQTIGVQYFARPFVAHVEDTDLKLARRHVAEAEVRIEAQRRLIERLEDAGQPTDLAAQLLTSLEDTMVQMRAHCSYLERAFREG